MRSCCDRSSSRTSSQVWLESPIPSSTPTLTPTLTLFAGRSSLEAMQRKHCSGRCLSGQTHAVYTEGGQHNYVGTARLGRTDLEFSGGIVHEVHPTLTL